MKSLISEIWFCLFRSNYEKKTCLSLASVQENTSYFTRIAKMTTEHNIYLQKKFIVKSFGYKNDFSYILRKQDNKIGCSLM